MSASDLVHLGGEIERFNFLPAGASRTPTISFDGMCKFILGQEFDDRTTNSSGCTIDVLVDGA
jgi:hypothetical protein